MRSNYHVLCLTSLLLLVSCSRMKVKESALCPEAQLRVSAKNMEPLLVRVPDGVKSVSFQVQVGNCSEHKSFHINTPEAFLDEHDIKWFQIASGVQCNRLYVVVNNALCYSRVETSDIDCDRNDLSFVFTSHVKIAKFCSGPPLSNDPLDKCANEEFERKLQILMDSEEIRKETQMTIPRYHRSVRVIFIPVGAIIFLISVSLRCCLYPRWKTGRSNRTIISVVRREPVREPESTSSGPTNLPPSYADIENECPPPPYSEVTAANDNFGLKTESGNSLEGDTHNSTGLDDGNPDRDTRSSLSRVLRAGPKSIKSQFSFKPMKEEE